MNVTLRAYGPLDIQEMITIWNEVVEEGRAFPQEDFLDEASGAAFFAVQTYCGVAEGDGRILGLYILHPNHIGRCSHLSNASFAVASQARGMRIGEALVKDCLRVARVKGFRILQFNAVVASNAAALHLYEKLGFVRLGTVPGGFRMKDGTYEDIVLFYHPL